MTTFTDLLKKIDRPLVFLDCETTGLDVMKDRIIQIALLKLTGDSRGEFHDLGINPSVPISPEASAVNGVTDEDVIGYPSFAEVAEFITEFTKGCDLVGYNSNGFDLQILTEELARVGIYNWPEPEARLLDLKELYFKLNPRNLRVAYKQYAGKELDNAHDAGADTYALPVVMEGMIEQMGGADSIEQLIRHSQRDKWVKADLAGNLVTDNEGCMYYNFGKHKGERVLSQLGYAEWMLKNGFPANTKRKLREYISNFPQRGI